MKAYCDIYSAHNIRDLDYSYQNLFLPISSIFNSYEGVEAIHSDTTHYFILDVGNELDRKINVIKQFRDSGIKVVVFTFDPANFNRIRRYIEMHVIDKVIVFSKKFENSFKCNTFFTDYFFLQDMFNPVDKINNGKVCMYGRIDINRPNDYSLDVIDINAKSIKDIYKNIQKYNGVATYDEGWNEDWSALDHYNKARATETLMCGRIPYCKDGIITKRYNKFLSKYSQIPSPIDIMFDQHEIWEINKLTLLELKYELDNA